MDNRKNNMDGLPDEMLVHIFSFFNTHELNKVREVSRRFYHLSQAEYLKKYPLLDYSNPILTQLKTKQNHDVSRDVFKYITILSDHLVLIGGYKGLHIVDVRSGECVQTLQVPSNFHSIKLPDNSLAIQCRQHIYILNYETGHHSLKIVCSGNFDFLCITALSDHHLVSGDRIGQLTIWDYHTNTKIRTISSTSHQLAMEGVHVATCVAALSNEQFISGHIGGKLKIWDCQTGKHVRTMLSFDINYKTHVCCISVLSNDQLASGYSDGRIKIWNYQTGHCLQTFKTEISNLHFSKKYQQTLYLVKLPNNQLICANEKGKIVIWNYKQGTCEEIPAGSVNSPFTDISGCDILTHNQILIARRQGSLETLSFPFLKQEKEQSYEKEPSKGNCLVM